MKRVNEATIVIADDHPIFRVGLKSIVDGMEGSRVVTEADNGTEAVRQFEKYRPDIAIIDLDMPDCDGIEVASRIFNNHLPTRVVILTAHTHPSTFFGGCPNGAG